MTENEIEAAIRAFTDHVRIPTNLPLEDSFGPQRTAEQLLAWRSDVEAVCSEMDALARNPRARFSDFETLRHKMGTVFPPTPLAFINRVADAFNAVGRA